MPVRRLASAAVIYLGLFVGMAASAHGQAATVKVAYDLPPQPSLDEMNKTDGGRTLLTDGRKQPDGPGSVWGRWNVKPYLVDWTFDQPVRIRGVRVSIVHPNPDSSQSHPAAVSLFGADERGGFLEVADVRLEIPFQSGKLQEVDLVLPGDGIVVRKLRTAFESARAQTVLTEVAFDSERVSDDVLAAAQAQRLAIQPPTMAPVTFLPVAATPSAEPLAPFFGVCGHFLHTDVFSPGTFSPWWRPEHTMPWVVAGGFGSVREALYLPLLAGEADEPTPNGRTVAQNRRQIEAYLADYQRMGVRVLLAPMFSAFRSQPDHFRSLMTWIGELSRRYDNIIGVEMHNEPNLRGFWKHTAEDYVEASRSAAALIRATGADVPIVVGSFAGWGAAAQVNDGIAYAGQGESRKAWHFAEAVFRLGALDFADAVSTHPYRNSSAPEGGLEIESPTDPQGFEKEITAWWQMVESHRPSNRPMKLYFTEVGYSSSTTGYAAVSTVDRQADYLSRLMLILHDVKLGGVPLEGVFWYDLKCDDADRGEYEANFGLIANDLSHARPGYLAYQRIAAFFRKPGGFERIDLQPAFSNWPQAVKSYTWRRTADGAMVVAFWRMNQLQRQETDFASELTLQLPADSTVGAVWLHDLHEAAPRPIGFRQDQSTLSIPLWLTARAAWLEITP